LNARLHDNHFPLQWQICRKGGNPLEISARTAVKPAWATGLSGVSLTFLKMLGGAFDVPKPMHALRSLPAEHQEITGAFAGIFSSRKFTVNQSQLNCRFRQFQTNDIGYLTASV